MISKLILKHFQAHKDSELSLVPGYNVIVGPSGVGKSSILRAIYYLFHNAPRTIDFTTRPDDKSFSIEAEVDGKVIKRVKGDGHNEYWMDSSKWEDFGTNIPSQILDTTKIKSAAFDDSLEFDLQIHRQHDSPFLLTETGSVKLKFLNRLANIHLIDICLKNLLSEQRELNGTINTLEGTISQLQSEVATETTLHTIERGLSLMEQKIEYLKLQKAHLDKLNMLRIRIQKWEADSKIIQQKLTLIQRIDIPLAIQKMEVLNTLGILHKKLVQVTSSIQYITQRMAKVGKIDTSRTSSIDKLIQLQGFKKRFLHLEESQLKLAERLRIINVESSNSLEKYTSFLLAHKCCPTCGQSVTEEVLSKVIQSL